MAPTKISIKEKKKRIDQELRHAGIFHKELHPFTSNYLLRVIHNDEHIMAAVFGRRKESEGFFGFVEGMLVATNERAFYLDHRPGYTTMDEVSYDKVSGVHVSSTLINSSVTLFTKIANYKLSFVGHTAAEQFAGYIESRLAHHEEATSEKLPFEATIQGDAYDFLRNHEVGVLSSVERTGALSGAVVYYTVRDHDPYFITKENSKKADNLLGDQHIAFTVYDEAQLKTIQIQGIVERVRDNNTKIEVLTALMHPRTYEDGSHKPPILRIEKGDIQTYRIVPTKFNYVDYGHR